jgi:hypothetical protein
MLLAVSAKRSTRTRTWPSASAAGSVLRKVVVARASWRTSRVVVFMHQR